jgi:hypothetical protein
MTLDGSKSKYTLYLSLITFRILGSVRNKKNLQSFLGLALGFMVNERIDLASCNICYYHSIFLGCFQIHALLDSIRGILITHSCFILVQV